MKITDKNAEKAAAGIRLLAMDLDGTLLTDDKRFTERCAEAVRTAAKCGIEPVYVTGRPLSGVPEDVLSVPGVRYIITSNGAVTTDTRTGRVLRSAGLGREVSEKIIREVLKRGYIFSVIADGYAFCDEDSFRRQLELFCGTPLEPYVRTTRRSVPDVFDVIKTAAVIENLWIKAPDCIQRDEIADYALEMDGTRGVITAPTDVEIGSPGSDKGFAVAHLAGLLGIERHQTAAIGDNGNDLGMLGSCGLAAVMYNAADDIKRCAQIIAASNNEDGAAEFIEWLASMRCV